MSSPKLWSQPSDDRDGATYSETGQEFVSVFPDGSVVASDAKGDTIRLPAGAAHAILACLGRALGRVTR
jgi:hypothetical protein